MLTQALVGGVSAVAGAYGSGYGQIASQLGMVGAGALLASYSRDNEREADDLGMAYMVRAGYNSEGMVGLMDMLKSQSKRTPNAVEMMFATHPMSEERYRTVVAASKGKYRTPANGSLYRDRYMDHTARLRAKRGAIEAMQNGEKEMAKKNFRGAQSQFKKAIQKAPRDYALLVMMAKCQLVQEKNDEARQYARIAKKVYPQEAQAYHISGFAKIRMKRYASALGDFEEYDRLLPGNPSMVFFKGFALEGMNRRKEAADHYYRYLQRVREGQQAQYAYKRLVEWGYRR
jgi:predicted Zn-dependent protease